MLREGLSKFSSTAGGNIPWKEILDLGSSVFLNCRTSVDQKDKWRNISSFSEGRGGIFAGGGIVHIWEESNLILSRKKGCNCTKPEVLLQSASALRDDLQRPEVELRVDTPMLKSSIIGATFRAEIKRA
ncbi:hypothetical protein SLEP1_g35113 [Rubroshorea leprosula]|uniref:Uncharacterized protein n=1 Tax=Rubroshorea leprosula TaxID=152421 RepID=A0AAV5KML9_9ROSI|nr:hypothetical protein SLEP1_g35113 [Rubroshorea leprosula]